MLNALIRVVDTMQEKAMGLANKMDECSLAIQQDIQSLDVLKAEAEDIVNGRRDDGRALSQAPEFPGFNFDSLFNLNNIFNSTNQEKPKLIKAEEKNIIGH